jgi:hypothetical protein
MNVMEHAPLGIYRTRVRFASVLKTGLLVGVADGIGAVVSAYIPKGTSPVKVFQFIASGVFGKEAFTGGTAMVVAGIVFHFVIALGWTAIYYYAVYPGIRVFSKHTIVTGVLYGFFVLMAMKFIVLPLSRVPMINPGVIEIRQLIIHITLVGLPISLLAHRHYSGKKLP